MILPVLSVRKRKIKNLSHTKAPGYVLDYAVVNGAHRERKKIDSVQFSVIFACYGVNMIRKNQTEAGRLRVMNNLFLRNPYRVFSKLSFHYPA